jgi:hypothetical protein
MTLVDDSRVKSAGYALAIVDDLAPVRPRINPTNAPALRTFQVGQYVGPLPFRQVVQLHGRLMPATFAVRHVADAIDQDAFESIRLQGGRLPVRPIAQSGIRLSTPRHGAMKRPANPTRKSHHPLQREEDHTATGGRCLIYRRANRFWALNRISLPWRYTFDRSAVVSSKAVVASGLYCSLIASSDIAL